MIDENIRGFLGCAGLTPFYMNRLVRDTFSSMEDYMRRNDIIFRLTGLYSIHVETSRGGEELVAYTVLHGKTCLDTDLLDASPLSIHPGHGFPPNIAVSEKGRVKRDLKDLLEIHGLKEGIAGRLLKRGVRCGRDGCYYSNYGVIRERLGYMALSIECRGNSLVFKTMDPADKVFSIVYNTIIRLISNYARMERIRLDKEILEETVAKALFNTLKWYIRKYMVIISGEAERLGFFTEVL